MRDEVEPRPKFIKTNDRKVNSMDPSLSRLALTIQASLAPVFLLSGIAGFLNVLHSRLLRVIDRTRFLETEQGDVDGIAKELRVLMIRRHWINRAITLCTISAVLVCGVVALLFIGALIHFNMTRVVATTFVAAMLALIVGLLSFLREVHLAVRFFRKGVAR